MNAGRSAVLLPSWTLAGPVSKVSATVRSEEHTSELQSQFHLVCRLLLEKKKYEMARLPPPLRPGRCRSGARGERSGAAVRREPPSGRTGGPATSGARSRGPSEAATDDGG